MRKIPSFKPSKIPQALLDPFLLEEANQTSIVEIPGTIPVPEPDDGDSRSSVFNMCVQWSVRVKEKAIELMKSGGNSVSDVYNLFGARVPYRTLFRWKKSGDHQRKEGSGRKALFPEIEELLFEWFIKQRIWKMPVNELNLRTKALLLKKKIQKTNIFFEEKLKALKACKFSRGWVQKFQKRHKLALRKGTTVSKKMRKDIEEGVKTFFMQLDSAIGAEKYKLIVNFDEVAVFFEMQSNQTLEIRGTKHVGIFATGHEKERATAILGVCSDGTRLPLVVIFKVVANKERSNVDVLYEPHVNSVENSATQSLIAQDGILALQNPKDGIILT